MGRSRLAHELASLAQRRGHLVLAGRAYPLDDRLTYAPIISSLGPHLRQLKPPQQAELLAGQPNLTRLLGGLPHSEGGFRQVHLLEEVARLAERLARTRPLVWIMDDLHLADLASVELFYYLARNIKTQRVLLLGTYRNDHSDGLRHLRVPLLSLARCGLSEEVRLYRLSLADVALLAGQRLGGRPADTLLDYLEGRAMGTPLITFTLLDSLENQGVLTRVGGVVGLSPAAVPRLSLADREIVLERLLPLSPQERQVLDLLAVMHGTAHHSELARAMGRNPADLLDSLASLQAAGLLSAEGSERDLDLRVSLSHPFLQDVLYAELPSLVRRQHHAQAAAALETDRSTPLERLARHYEGSGGAPDPERAIEVMMRAAEGTLLTGGPEAADYYRMALALVRSGLFPERLPVVLLGLGQALSLSGQFDVARERLREALAVCEELGDGRGAGTMHMHAAYIELMLGDLDATEAHLRSGLAQFPPDSPGPELVHLCGLRFNVHLLRSDIAALPQDIADLAQAAEREGTPMARAWHLHARTWGELLSGQVDTALSTAREGLEEAWRSRDPNLVMLTALDHAHIRLIQGDHRATAAELRDVLERLPNGYLLVAQHVLGPMLSMAETLGGDWEAALKVSDQSAPLEPHFQALPRANLGARTVILIRRGDLAEARACLDEASHYPRPFVTDCDYAEALFALECGEYQRAAETAARLYTWSLAPLGIALLAEAQAALGEVEAVRNLAAFLTGMGSLNLPLATALGTWVTGLADRTAGETDAAIAAFAAAAEQFEQLAIPFDSARARFEQAQLVGVTDRGLGSDLARRSLQAFALLGADLWVDRVRRWRAGRRPRAGVVSPKLATPFSARELEILRLLDQGLTNGEIALRLVLSPRTVANHLDRMYTRHGLRNRTGLVRFARDGGFL